MFETTPRERLTLAVAAVIAALASVAAVLFG